MNKRLEMQENSEISESFAEAMAKWLLGDTEMRSLLSAAMTKVANERPKKSLALLLEHFAEKLTTGSALEPVAHIVGSRTLDVLDQMLSRLPRETQSTTETSLPSHQDVLTANDRIQDLVETLRNLGILHPLEVKTVLSQFDDTKLKYSLPFTELKEDLRRFVYNNMKSYIREMIQALLLAPNMAPRYSVGVRIHWELEHYAKDDIGNILTLTGEVARAQALLCGEYMQQTWPRTGTATLAAVKDALLRGWSNHLYSSTHTIKLELEESEANAFETAGTVSGRPLFLLITGTPAEILETIEQFAWFASAFRSVGENSTGLSQVDFRVLSESSHFLMTEIILLPLRTYVDTEPSYGSRWPSLITSSALAWGFRIKERTQAVGLEIPFQGMLTACRVRYPVVFQDSIIIHQGHLTIYPIAKHHDGVQWHAVVGGCQGFFDELKTFPILSMGKDVDFFSPSNFSQFRTFVD